MKKIISLCLALCMICALSVSAFAADIDTNGGSGSTPVNLSSTDDGTIGGDPNRIFPGQVLVIPGGIVAPAAPQGRRSVGEVTVQAGDTLTGIARRYPQGDVTASSIAGDNGISDPNLIFPGQVLTIFTAE